MFAFFVKVRASEQTCFNVSILVRLDLLRTRFITLITEELVRRDTALSLSSFNGHVWFNVLTAPHCSESPSV